MDLPLDSAKTEGPPSRVDAMRDRILSKLMYEVCKDPKAASPRDWFVATAMAVRDPIADRWLASTKETYATAGKRVAYMSLEFLIGRLLSDALENLGVREDVRSALAGLGVDLEDVRAVEPDAALGNGGLGRLAACYIESMASVGVPAHGYGIRYENGLFRQSIGLGFWQQEWPEDWLALGNPWEFRRPELTFDIGFGGAVALEPNGEGPQRYRWTPAETVFALAYDTPIVGAGGRHVNTLRLWSARASNPLRLEDFNRGDHVGALADRVRAEAISRVLYPSDESPAGLELRLRQEFFFVSASLQDMLRRHLAHYADLANFADKVAIQLNDTHPAIGIAELMRLLVDVHGLEWDRAWRITSHAFCYTNHTLLPEALEMWPVPLMERLLPRHMQIIYLINNTHLEVAKRAGHTDDAFLAGVSLIDETNGRRVRMGHLAYVGSRRINGVSALHTDLMQRTIFHDLDSVHPGRIVNKTNGITFRRWLYTANIGLTDLLAETIGERVRHDPMALTDLEPFADDAGFRDLFRAQRRRKKEALAGLIRRELAIGVDPDAMFDVQIKRIHEYKRQLLNVLQIVAAYGHIRAHPHRDHVPRVKIFAGKAAASYLRAKQVIQLAHDVARTVNSDPSVRGLLKVAFLPNYNVTLAESIIPAADLSEQISTAGMEASGTGNMKLALNGALTIGTLDGANVEIRDHVGSDNIFIFGLTVAEVGARKANGLDAIARDAVAASPGLAEVLHAVRSGVFSPDEPARYHGLIDDLMANDRFLVTADFDLYCNAQDSVDRAWTDTNQWWRKAVLNTANMGWFSSDRAIREYAAEVWRVPLSG
jgi:starch phosphorylase